ncbi:MAG: hypothetical protein ACXIT9_10910 [Nitritalea sp.]
MKELSMDKMEMVNGGNIDCAVAILEAEVGIFSLASALASTGVMAPLGVGLAVASLCFLAYGVYKNGDPC